MIVLMSPRAIASGISACPQDRQSFWPKISKESPVVRTVTNVASQMTNVTSVMSGDVSASLTTFA